MARLRRIEPSGFRGARLPVALDFENRCASAVVFGSNGHGKSSFVDALECYINETIDHLNRENVGRAAYRNRALEDDEVASVRVEFSEAELSGSLEVSADRRITLTADSESTRPFRTAAAGEMTILRHKDLALFVDMTKGQKLDALAPLIGLEALSDIRSTLVSTRRRLEQDLVDEDRVLQGRRRSIEETLGDGPFSDERLWELIGRSLSQVGISESVQDSVALASVLKRVSVTANAERDKDLKNLRAAHDAVGMMADLRSGFTSVDAFTSAFNVLASDPAVARETQLVEVWEAGRGVVSSEWWKADECPLCGETTDLHQLNERIEHQLQAAAETLMKLEKLEDLRREAQADIETAAQILKRTLEATEDVEQCESLTATVKDELSVSLRELERTIRSQRDAGPISAGVRETWRAARTRAEDARKTCLEALTKSIEELSPTAQERSRLDAYRRLSSVESDLRYMEQVNQNRRIIDTHATSIREILEQFEQHERETVAAVLSRISEDVSTYYRKLHGGERYDNVRLVFLPEDRGLEFSMEAYGETISPPRLLLSESHLGSLGLCLFLAAAREFNSATNFLVLDDVVNSFDANHRANLAALLVEEFEDFQVIAFTHDPIWFETLRRTASSWVEIRIAGWSRDLGIRIVGNPADERLRIEEFLGQGDEGIAGNLTRQFVEHRLKRLCEVLRVPVPYRQGYANDQRTAHDLFVALRTHCRTRNRFRNADHPVWGEFETSNFLANLASHDQPEMVTALSAGDILYALDKLDQLESVFRCGDCGKLVWLLRSSPNDDKSQCGCGNLKI